MPLKNFPWTIENYCVGVIYEASKKYAIAVITIESGSAWGDHLIYSHEKERTT